MKSILVATDFSERSDRALRRATMLAKQTGAALSLIHVIDDDQPERIVESERDAASQLLYEQSATLRNMDGVTCDTQVILGAPFAGIVQAVGDRTPDLLVIGPHRRQALRDMFIGTTAERTIRSVACPVLMANSPPVGSYRNVLLTADLSDGSHSAIDSFASLKMAGGARTSVVYVFDAPTLGLAIGHAMPKEDKEYYLKKECEDAARKLAQFMGPLDVELAEHIVRHDNSNPANEILTVAEETEAGLIVVGTRGRSGLAKLLLGSVAEAVLRKAEVDVLAVPPKRYQ
ncbi:universal stress protein [Ferruginivarius sediminum]|uniref:Universal stress protein n=1 Tax=Ferruginivarius sediminum TaxID=2661937 RepID=A0A369TDM6_9PROT|nr:universal stress protein [Ferruginivarius sediminum]RDD62485.1 universal stress protein [Ferruginivarius sediminum]